MKKLKKSDFIKGNGDFNLSYFKYYMGNILDYEIYYTQGNDNGSKLFFENENITILINHNYGYVDILQKKQKKAKKK